MFYSFLACLVKSISEIAELYVMSCRKHKTKPLQTVLDHLKGVELNKQQRQPVLSLKSIKLAASDCEALEEIFKRVIDLHKIRYLRIAGNIEEHIFPVINVFFRYNIKL